MYGLLFGRWEPPAAMFLRQMADCFTRRRQRVSTSVFIRHVYDVYDLKFLLVECFGQITSGTLQTIFILSDAEYATAVAGGERFCRNVDAL